jgi:hypothetical protein
VLTILTALGQTATKNQIGVTAAETPIYAERPFGEEATVTMITNVFREVAYLIPMQQLPGNDVLAETWMIANMKIPFAKALDVSRQITADQVNPAPQILSAFLANVEAAPAHAIAIPNVTPSLAYLAPAPRP